jgi:hypothetical protein
MLASSPVPQMSAAGELSADHVGELLAAGGYRNADIAVSERYALPEGCGVALQFGETIVGDREGVPRLTLRCNVALNGRDAHSGYATRWNVDKVVRLSAGDELINFAIEVKLVLGRRVLLDDIVAHGGDAFRHLRHLVADARATLMSLPVAGEAALLVEGRALRIEARYVGDLAAGRSGFVGLHAADAGRPKASAARSRMFRIASRDQRLIGAACDCLSDRILPDLARALRQLVARETVPMRRSAPCEIGSKRHPASPRRLIADPQVEPFDVAELADLVCEPPP